MTTTFTRSPRRYPRNWIKRHRAVDARQQQQTRLLETQGGPSNAGDVNAATGEVHATFRAAVEAVLDDPATTIATKIELLRDLLKEKEKTTAAVEKGTSKAQEILDAAENKGNVSESKAPKWLKRSVTAVLLESPPAPNKLQRCYELIEMHTHERGGVRGGDYDDLDATAVRLMGCGQQRTAADVREFSESLVSREPVRTYDNLDQTAARLMRGGPAVVAGRTADDVREFAEAITRR